MKSSKVKVMHEIAGMPMVCYPAKTADKLNYQNQASQQNAILQLAAHHHGMMMSMTSVNI